MPPVINQLSVAIFNGPAKTTAVHLTHMFSANTTIYIMLLSRKLEKAEYLNYIGTVSWIHIQFKKCLPCLKACMDSSPQEEGKGEKVDCEML